MKYMLDTNTLIYFFKGHGRVAQHLLAVPPSEIGILAIVLYEIEVGIAKSTFPQKRKAQLEDFLSMVNVVPFGGTEARIAASLRARLERQGCPIGPYDILIAASALANNCTLVTHNKGEFARIDQLKIEDWY
jgi:tRNA(fMet)-specific endonuclease VapC